MLGIQYGESTINWRVELTFNLYYVLGIDDTDLY